MCPDEPQRHTVTVSKQFIVELCEHYPAATSTSQAIAMAAQDGLTFRKSFDDDLKSYVRKTVRDVTLERVEESEAEVE